METSRSTIWTDLGAALSLGAGLVHAAAAGTHSGDSVVVGLFAATAVVQVCVGVTLLTGPTRRTLLVGAALNAAAVAAWAASRTAGLPLVDALAGREAVGVQDATAAALAVGAALATIAALGRRVPSPAAGRVRWLPALAILPVLLGVAATHQHDEGQAHGHGEEVEVASGDTHDHENTAHEDTTHDDAAAHDDGAHDDAAAHDGAADPVLAGADTSQATEAEVDEAAALVTATRDAIDPGTDTATVEAAGYVWIGDGRRVGGFQHYISHELLEDGRVLDPDHIEAFVFENTTEGPVLATAMYVLERGTTMTDVPDTGGGIAVWHDHQNLCWDASGTKLAGISTDGETCRPAGTFQATPPMLHVWLDDQKCGPFVGLEGHGSADCSAHGH